MIRPTLESWSNIATNRLDRGHGAFPHTLSLVATWFKKNKQELETKTFAPHKAIPGEATKMQVAEGK